MMRTSFSFFLLCVLSLGLSAQNGIEFFHGEWAEVLEQARKERKPIFVDAYAVWCGPCKMMSRNVFTDEKVGKFFNQNFVNYKFDMEKGEGPAFARKYFVNAYPTLLFINHKGELIHRVEGYRPPKQFMNEGNKALDPARNQSLLQLEFEEGTASPEQMYSYALNLKAAGEDYSEAAAKYFATQSPKQLRSAVNWEAIRELSSDMNGPEFRYLLKKQKKFAKKHGARAVRNKITEVLKKETIAAALLKDKARYLEAINIADKSIKDDGQTASFLKVVYAEARKDWADYAYKAIYHFDTFSITEPEALDQAVRNFTQYIADPEQLQHAVDWARRSVVLQNASYNNESYARLLLKLGQKDQALKQANKSLQLAYQEGIDTLEIEELIQTIRSSK
ncbi:MAG: thioredoxin fold domain-containing protein [Bacteroidota bacterium]